MEETKETPSQEAKEGQYQVDPSKLPVDECPNCGKDLNLHIYCCNPSDHKPS